MLSLRQKLAARDRFLVGTELVSVRGSMAERSAVKARGFARDLVDYPRVDWISITDNAGGNPQLAPTALGKPILYAGKEVVIHLTCKDLNRNALESEAWLLHSEGFHNILAMTGDYPVSGSGGSAKPVFDIDSVGLIALLRQMNEGFDPNAPDAVRRVERFDRTQFLVGAVTTNFKRHEGEVMPQYFKLRKKVECGAHFIINQIGFDAGKISELRLYMDHHDMAETPLIGNVYLLSGRVAEIFHSGRIPGVVVTDALRELCARHAQSADKGKAFFTEFAAKQIAIYRGLGFDGVYLGGVHTFPAVEELLRVTDSFAPDDWKTFAREQQFSRPGEFCFYGRNPDTGLADASLPTENASTHSKHTGLGYALAKASHHLAFMPGKPLNELGKSLCAKAKNPAQGPALMRVIEHAGKSAFFRCKDCGDCSLPEIAYLCPESQCAKNQRNGPCGGTRDGRCEVDGYGDCIWLRAYERRKADGEAEHLLDHAPTIQNQALRGTSAWANNWLGKDHVGKKMMNDE